MTEIKHTERLLNEARALIGENKIKDGDQYIKYLKPFFALCKHDEIFRLAKIEWDGTYECFDIWWETKLLDSYCSFNLDRFSFKIWIGEDSRKSNAECYFIGHGVCEYENSKEAFADEFYKYMDENLDHINADEPYSK